MNNSQMWSFTPLGYGGSLLAKLQHCSQAQTLGNKGSVCQRKSMLLHFNIIQQLADNIFLPAVF